MVGCGQTTVNDDVFVRCHFFCVLAIRVPSGVLWDVIFYAFEYLGQCPGTTRAERIGSIDG